MKKCSCCKTLKNFEEYNKNRSIKDGYAKTCRECMKVLRKNHYKKNSARLIKEIHQRRKDIKQWFRDYKSTLKCENCGFSHPATLDFHHRDPSEKENLVSMLVCMANSKQNILDEISKCDVLCSNCHRIHHYEEYMNRIINNDVL